MNKSATTGKPTLRKTTPYLLLVLIFSLCALYAATPPLKVADHSSANTATRIHPSQMDRPSTCHKQTVNNTSNNIFATKSLRWEDLSSDRRIRNYDNSHHRILGTFPVPHDHDGTDMALLKHDRHGIYFKKSGAYYLHTSIGHFKLLLLDKSDAETNKIKSIASFVSGNMVHSPADSRLLANINICETQPESLVRVLFRSDQPLKLHCGNAARFLAYIFSLEGYRVQLVSLLENGHQKHMVTQVLDPVRNSYIMIDPDFGALFTNKAGKMLSIQEASSVIHSSADNILIEDIGNKHWLEPKYNQANTLTDFKWTPGTATTKTLDNKADYIEFIRRSTFEYIIFEQTPDGWNWAKPVRFKSYAGQK